MSRRKKKIRLKKNTQTIESGDQKNERSIENANETAATAPDTLNLSEQIGAIVKNLHYLSESDAEILPFTGLIADAVTNEEILKQTVHDPKTSIERQDFAEFFGKLTAIEDWFGEEEKQIAVKYQTLKDLLQANIRDLAIFKVGKINLDIYAVGLDSDNILIGVQTKATET